MPILPASTVMLNKCILNLCVLTTCIFEQFIMIFFLGLLINYHRCICSYANIQTIYIKVSITIFFYTYNIGLSLMGTTHRNHKKRPFHANIIPSLYFCTAISIKNPPILV